MKIIDLNSFPEIQDARFFEGTETQNVIYYATSTKIYSINLAIANPLVTLEYTAPEGEEITSMMAWKEYQGKVDYTNPNPNADADDKVIEVSNNNRMIVLSTYNPSSRDRQDCRHRHPGYGHFGEEPGTARRVRRIRPHYSHQYTESVLKTQNHETYTIFINSRIVVSDGMY